jgi:hypothetical protein
MSDRKPTLEVTHGNCEESGQEETGEEGGQEEGQEVDRR